MSKLMIANIENCSECKWRDDSFTLGNYLEHLCVHPRLKELGEGEIKSLGADLPDRIPDWCPWPRGPFGGDADEAYMLIWDAQDAEEESE